MKIWEFLSELEFFFKYTGSEDDKNKVFSTYVDNLEGIALSKKCEYDWKKVLDKILQTYSYTKFPALADIIKCLPDCEIIQPYKECTDEGALIVVTLKNGTIYPFTVSAHGRAKESILEEMRVKYGISDIKTYPAGSVLIGKEVTLP